MCKRLSILGSTGSIGTQALDVVRLNGFTVCALTANSRIDLLEEQIRAFHPALAAVVDEEAAKDLRARVADTGTKVLAGMDGVIECARCAGADTVLNAIVGMAGLLPTLAAIEAGKEIALANKETLVAGGKLVMEAARKRACEFCRWTASIPQFFSAFKARPRGKGCPQAHYPDGLWRPVFRQDERRTARGNGGAGAQPPQLEHGREDHDRFRHHDE